MTGRRPTISDVAKRAFVSKTTVSHVVNGTRFVAPDTKQRVLDAIDELGYRPNTAARSLTTKRTGIVGMIISDASNQFFGEVLRGVEDVLGPEGYGLIVCNTDEILERERHYLDLLLSQQVEGIIAAATSRRWQELLRAEVTRTPVVYVDRSFQGMDGPYIGVDNHRGAYTATRHFIETGRRELGIIAGFQRLSTMRERLEGFKAAIADAGIPLVEQWIAPCPLSVDAARQATQRILALPQHPDALLTSNNLLSLGALLALQRMGMRCPDDVALIGFDDHPWAMVSAPPLSVVRQPARQVGRESAKLLLTLVGGKQPDKACIQLGCEFVHRQSCCLSTEPVQGTS